MVDILKYFSYKSQWTSLTSYDISDCAVISNIYKRIVTSRNVNIDIFNYDFD